jgi:hypothetical protein
MKLPRHIALDIRHNDHKADYRTAREWWGEQGPSGAMSFDDDEWASPEEFAKAMESDEVWVIHWYPDTPVGSCTVLASTLEAALAAAQDDEPGTSPTEVQHGEK